MPRRKKEMMVVYVAGAYRSKWFIRKCLNIKYARKVSDSIWREGVAAICPHSNTAFVEDVDKYILPGYIEIALRCDAILALPNWRKSEGTKAELRAGIRADMPIYFSKEVLLTDIKKGKLRKFTDIMSKLPEIADLRNEQVC